MYANRLENRVGKIDVQAGPLVQGKRSIPVVDAIATVNESGKSWSIALVNRHPSESVECTVRMGDKPLNGTYKATILAGDSPDSYNDIEHPDRVAPKEMELTFTQGVANLPPHSLTILKATTP